MLIKEVFFPVDAEAIIRQPMGQQGHDRWAWEPEKSGIYSVRSPYKLLFKKQEEENQNHEPGASTDGLWKIIWNLEIPPKVKVFWWRVVHEFLLARHILWKRHIEPIAFREVCGAPEKSIAHVLLYCSVAREFWHQVRVGIGVKIPSLNPVTWASDLISGICSSRDTAAILCGMWTLWMMRTRGDMGNCR